MGNEREAIVLMTAAADMESQTSKHPVTPGEILPADELLADMYLAIGQPNKALTVYELNLKRRPNRFNGIYGAAVAAKQSGNKEKTLLYFNSLLKLTKKSNSKRPEIKEAEAWVDQFSI